MALGLGRRAWLQTATIARTSVRGPPLDRPSAFKTDPLPDTYSGPLDILEGASDISYEHVEEHSEGGSPSLLFSHSSPFPFFPSLSFVFAPYFFLPPFHFSALSLLLSLSFLSYHFLPSVNSLYSILPLLFLSLFSFSSLFYSKIQQKNRPVSLSLLCPPFAFFLSSQFPFLSSISLFLPSPRPLHPSSPSSSFPSVLLMEVFKNPHSEP